MTISGPHRKGKSTPRDVAATPIVRFASRVMLTVQDTDGKIVELNMNAEESRRLSERLYAASVDAAESERKRRA